MSRPSVRPSVRPYARIRAGDEFAGNPRFLAGNRIQGPLSVLINFLRKKIQNDCISVCLKIKREGKTFYSNLLLCRCRQTRV